MSSSEFRKRFARLTETTRVTANGHVIGIWMPPTPYVTVEEVKRDMLAVQSESLRPFAEFRPVPKPGKGK